MTEVPAFWDFRSYQIATRRTVQKHLTIREKHFQNTIGLIGEVTEVTELLLTSGNLNESEIKKELGDVLWYMARLLDDFGLDMEKVAKCTDTKSFGLFLLTSEINLIQTIGEQRTTIGHARNMVKHAGFISEHLKKHFFQQHELDLYKISYHCRKLLLEMSMVAFLIHSNMEEVAESNLEKSAKRYPNGFNANNSIYRFEYMEHDLDCE